MLVSWVQQANHKFPSQAVSFEGLMWELDLNAVSLNLEMVNAECAEKTSKMLQHEIHG